jgi:putative tryptophan/tyrosine transport system permease protein
MTMEAILLDALVTGLPLIPVFLGIYTVFRLREDFDLTVEGSFALGGAATAVTLVAGVHPAPALAVGTLVGGLCGVVTAALHLWLRIPVLLAGLVMSIGLFSVTLHVLGMPTKSLLGASTLFTVLPAMPAIDDDLRMAIILAVLVAALVGAYAWFLRTEVGLALRATGVNARMARSQGVNDRAIAVVCLFITNAMAGFGGGLVVQTQGYADVNMGIGTFVAGVGALLLGELLVRPSRSSVLRIVVCVAVGSLAYRLILAAALRAGLAASDLRGVTALTLVIAVAAQRHLGDAVRLLRGRVSRAPALRVERSTD